MANHPIQPVQGGLGTDVLPTVGQVPVGQSDGTYLPGTVGGGSPGSPDTSIQYNSSGSFAGSSTLTFNGTDVITFGAESTTSLIVAPDATTVDTAGGGLEIDAGAGNGTGDGGSISIQAGNSITGNAGSVSIGSGSGGSNNQAYASLDGVNSQIVLDFDSAGGALILDGSVTPSFKLTDGLGSGLAALTTSALTADRTYTFPNRSGVLATDPMTTAGDIIYENGTPAPVRLGIGTEGQVLTVTSGFPSWVDAMGGGVTNLDGGTASSVYLLTQNISGGGA